MKYVDKNKNLKKLQNTELEILKYFDDLCKKNKLDYYMAYGTLLGAVRHKGFIPWDDDVDLHMKGKDYLKLINLLKDNKDKKYFFQSLETEKNYYLLWNKVRLNNTIFIEKGWEDNEIHKGISLDIFPLIEYPDNDKDKRKIDWLFKITKLLIDCNMKYNKNYKSYGLSGKILFKIFRLIPQKIRNKKVIKNINFLCNYESDSEYYFTTDAGLGMKISKDIFEEKVTLIFESEKFVSPKKHHEYLECVYGDYMKLPDEADRIGHGETYLCFNTTGDKNDK